MGKRWSSNHLSPMFRFSGDNSINSSLIPLFNDTIGRSLLVSVDYCFTNLSINLDVSARRILDAGHVAVDGGTDGAVLEREYSVIADYAVLHNQILAIAQWLFARDAATNKAKVLGIPSQIFAVYLAVIDSHVLALPQRVLRVEHTVLNLHIL